MRKPLLFGLLASLALLPVTAAPKDDVVNAARKLAETSYAWKSTAEPAGGFNGGPTEGKTDKAGLIYVSMTMRDNAIEIVKQGAKGAFKGEEGWQSVSEAANAEGPGRFIGMMADGLTAPAAEVQDLAAKATELKMADGVISGDLPEDVAKSVVMPFKFPGGDGPTVSGAKASVKFWVKDGVLAKYEVKTQGKVSFNGNDRDIDRTTTTEIKEVGTTKVELPDDAKKKLM
jgi:hypothetical protein